MPSNPARQRPMCRQPMPCGAPSPCLAGSASRSGWPCCTWTPRITPPRCTSSVRLESAVQAPVCSVLCDMPWLAGALACLQLALDVFAPPICCRAHLAVRRPCKHTTCLLVCKHTRSAHPRAAALPCRQAADGGEAAGRQAAAGGHPPAGVQGESWLAIAIFHIVSSH